PLHSLAHSDKINSSPRAKPPRHKDKNSEGTTFFHKKSFLLFLGVLAALREDCFLLFLKSSTGR
ncbi:MAG TPA: hypothetical protein VNX47_13000, partial [Nevskia sp.]|nr:hypothetical protein [Nevskia sp.]